MTYYKENISNSHAYGGWLSPKGKFFIIKGIMDHDRTADELIEKLHLKPKISGDGTTMLGNLGWLRIVVVNQHPTIMTADTTGDIDQFQLSREQKIFLENWLFGATDRTVIINGKDYTHETPIQESYTYITKKQLKWIVKEIVEQINRVDESFDLKPVNPKVKFSVNGWQWRPIMELIDKANDTFHLNIKDLEKWHFNNGNGLKTQEECNKLADALTSLIGNQPYNRPIRGEHIPKNIPGVRPGVNPFETDVGTVQKFIKFLRECNGFEIW